MEREKRKKMLPEETTMRKKKSRKEERGTAAATAAETEEEGEEPTTEEVEEFYAILRRMDVAMRYLRGAQKRLIERRTPAEETSAVVRIGQAEEIKELNLNEVPSDSSD